MNIVNGIPDVIRLLIILSILVVAHEWGHFIMARLFKIGVEDFSIGFGKRLIRLGKRGDTEFNIRMLPLGGFVKIQGMEADDEAITIAKEKIGRRSADPDSHELPLIAENRDTATPGDDPEGFNSRPLYQRTLVILGGPVMSFVLGWFILMFVGCTVGTPSGKVTNRVNRVMPGGVGQSIDLRAGDVITSINGKPIVDGAAMVFLINRSLGKTLVLNVKRDGQTLTKTAVPQPLPGEDGKPRTKLDVDEPAGLKSLGLQTGDTIQGIDDTPIATSADLQKALDSRIGENVEITVSRGDKFKVLKGKIPADVTAALPVTHSWTIAGLYFEPASEIRRVSVRQSIRDGNAMVAEVFKNLWHIIQIRKLHESTGGVLRMYEETHIAAKAGLSELFFLAAQISISLAIFNMLPIPILDGGHLVSFFVEWIRHGKKMTLQQQQAFLLVGLAVIGALFVLITGHDILNRLQGKISQ